MPIGSISETQYIAKISDERAHDLTLIYLQNNKQKLSIKNPTDLANQYKTVKREILEVLTRN